MSNPAYVYANRDELAQALKDIKKFVDFAKRKVDPGFYQIAIDKMDNLVSMLNQEKEKQEQSLLPESDYFFNESKYDKLDKAQVPTKPEYEYLVSIAIQHPLGSVVKAMRATSSSPTVTSSLLENWGKQFKDQIRDTSPNREIEIIAVTPVDRV